MTGQNYQPADRRPIRARSTRWAAAVTDRLVAARVTPNAISIAGMVAAIAAGMLLGLTGLAGHGVVERLLWLSGVVLVQARLACNLLDGMVAVKAGIASPVGELYNEVPDRVADAAVLVGLGYASGASVTLGYIAAGVAIFVAYVRAMAKAAGAPNDFSGPLAKPHRMFVVTVVGLYLALAPTNWRSAMAGDDPWGIAAVGLLVVALGGAYTALRRLRSAARALGDNET